MLVSAIYQHESAIGKCIYCSEKPWIFFHIGRWKFHVEHVFCRFNSSSAQNQLWRPLVLVFLPWGSDFPGPQVSPAVGVLSGWPQALVWSGSWVLIWADSQACPLTDGSLTSCVHLSVMITLLSSCSLLSYQLWLFAWTQQKFILIKKEALGRILAGKLNCGGSEELPHQASRRSPWSCVDYVDLRTQNSF